MKISIITPTLNCEKTLPITLASILGQNYRNLEHIIVDGGSNDNTVKILKKYPNKNKKLFLLKKKKLYESINYGIKKSKGELITILNSDDFYNNYKIISEIAQIVKKSKHEIFIGNTLYFAEKKFENITRNYNVKFFSRKKIKLGLMPSHTASFVRKKTYQEIGLYNENMKIAADFDFFLRAILVKDKKYKYINKIISRMKNGGISSRNLYSQYVSTKEILSSFKQNKIKTNIFFILARIPMKLYQFFNINNKILNKEFVLPKIKIYENYFTDFRMIKKISNIRLDSNFILSAMNLAFLGSYFQNQIKFNPDLIHWPDGIFSKTLGSEIKKIPGRKLLIDLKLKNHIKRIIVLGNLTFKGRQFLVSVYKKKIVHEKLIYGSPREIYERIKYKKFLKTDLVFLTLPTPKQEVVANLLSEKNKFFKIICIGGSIAIASGEEKEVPKIFLNFEWVWRLRYETRRRMLRLLQTFIYYSYGKILNKKTKNLTVKYFD
jgi:glycosyltransferase involved in cell wall biosynthesis